MQGKFISIDGIDGCGKSTQTHLLYNFFTDNNISCILTKEPGGGFEDVIRALLLNPYSKVNAIAETLLFFADRIEHLEKKIIPNLNSEVSVISDRFLASTYAYQVFGRKVDLNLVDFLRNNTIRRLPDVTFIIDIPIEVAMERTYNKMLGTESRFENMGKDFYERVASGFDWYINKAPHKIFDFAGNPHFEHVYKIDGNRPIKEVFADIKKILFT